MKHTLPALALLLFSLGLPAGAQTPPPSPAAKAKSAVENAADKAADATGKATEKAKDAVKKTTDKAAAPAKSLPFYGEVSSVDKTAQTVTLGENVYQITSATVIHDGETAAKFSDIKVGRKIGGSYLAVGGKKELVKLNLGVKQESAKPAPKEKAKAESKTKAPAAEAEPAAPAPASEGTAPAPAAKPAKKKAA